MPSRKSTKPPPAQPDPVLPESITVEDRTFTILFPDLLPPLDEETLTGLRESIRLKGIGTPVVLDEDDNIIDGINRLRIAAEIGLEDFSYTTCKEGLTYAQKRQLALDLNLHRRHLDADQLHDLRQQRIGRVAEKRQEGKSLRTIAEEEGVSKTQVERDLEEAAGVPPGTPGLEEASGVSGDTPDLEEAKAGVPPGTPKPQEAPKVQGRDGKKYPAKKKKPLPVVPAYDDGEDEPDEDPATPKKARMADEELLRRYNEIEEERLRRYNEIEEERLRRYDEALRQYDAWLAQQFALLFFEAGKTAHEEGSITAEEVAELAACWANELRQDKQDREGG